MILKTPLYSQHVLSGAKLIDFHGWEMPLHYGSQLQEHQYVRHDAGVFDVSHMTIVDVLGAGGRQFLRHILTADIDTLKHVGRAVYSCMCNEYGGIIDDLIVYQRAPDNYRLICNSATRLRVLAWLHQHIIGFSAGLQERTDLAMLAVQGPHAIEKISALLNLAQVDALSTLAPFESVEIDQWFFARTGYTGEDGLEIIVPQQDIGTLWADILQAGIKPCGLAARDTLRLEAGLLLSGQDMDESTTPLESGLSWTVSSLSDDRGFIGMGALLSQQQTLKRRLVGLTLEEPGIMRSGMRVKVEGLPDGVVTSGTYSPTLNQSIAFARVPVGVTDEVLVEVRDKWLRARVGKLRFIPRVKDIKKG
jgi:aminomethyltransferase